MLLQDMSIRTIQHRHQMDLNLPSCCTDNKPLLTSPMWKRRLQICNDYLHWTSADWKTVTISDESTFIMVREGSKLVGRTPGSSRYDSKSTVNTVNYPDSVMVWGAFSGNNSRWGLFFFPKNITLAGSGGLEVLEQHILPIWDIHQCHHHA